MKKRFLPLILSLLFVLSFAAGCSKDASTQYHDAFEKTVKIEKLTQSVDFEINIDSSGLNLSPEEKMSLQLYSSIKGTFNAKTDVKGEKAQFEGNISLGGVGIAAKGFLKDNKFVFQIPMFPQYIIMDINELQKLSGQPVNTDTNELQETLVKKVTPLWKEAVSKDKVKKLGDKKISIGGSEVNTTEIEFSLSNEEINKLLSSLINVILKDDEFKKIMINSINQQNPDSPITEAEFDAQMSQVLPALEDFLKDLKVENFKYNGNIDKDSYILHESLSFDMSLQIPESGTAKIGIKYTIKRSDIGKDVTVEMPELNESNSIDFKDLMGDMSEMPSDF